MTTLKLLKLPNIPAKPKTVIFEIDKKNFERELKEKINPYIKRLDPEATHLMYIYLEELKYWTKINVFLDHQFFICVKLSTGFNRIVDKLKKNKLQKILTKNFQDNFIYLRKFQNFEPNNPLFELIK